MIDMIKKAAGSRNIKAFKPVCKAGVGSIFSTYFKRPKPAPMISFAIVELSFPKKV